MAYLEKKKKTLGDLVGQPPNTLKTVKHEEHEEYKGQDRYGELALRDHFVNKSEFSVPFPSCLCRIQLSINEHVRLT